MQRVSICSRKAGCATVSAGQPPLLVPPTRSFGRCTAPWSGDCCTPSGEPWIRAWGAGLGYGGGAVGGPTSGGGYDETGGSSPGGGVMSNEPAARMPSSIC